MINLKPTICNLCGGKVIYIKNSEIYGKSYGSGFCYYCTECLASVGTHKDRPEEAMGILADDMMKHLRQVCHNRFDKMWSDSEGRTNLYKRLADELGIEFDECHFGHMDLDTLHKADIILLEWEARTE